MSMSDRDGKIWMDGQLVEWRDAKIHVLSHTLHYGCGTFEGVRAYNTASHGTAICASITCPGVNGIFMRRILALLNSLSVCSCNLKIAVPSAVL